MMYILIYIKKQSYPVLKVHSVKIKKNDCKIQTTPDSSVMMQNYEPSIDKTTEPYITDVIIIGKVFFLL